MDRIRPMRRKNLARKDAEFFDYVLQKANEMYFAFSTEDAPYVVPLNFVYINGKIYFHSALEGRKVDCIRENPKVGFSIAVDIDIIPEEATTYYNSVIGTGTATIVEDSNEKGSALATIARRYAASCEQPATETMLARTLIIRVDVEHICGKEKKSHIPISEI